MLRPHSRSALTEPLFRRYFAAAWQATLGTWINRFLLGWLAWELTESALWVGITGACMLFPAIVLSPLFGVLSDRINPRNGMLVTLLAQSVVAGVAAGAIFADLFSLVWLVGLALAIGGISAAHHPLRLALIPRLVSRQFLPSAIGLSAIVFNISRIIGPALAGPMIAYTSAGVPFVLAAALFFGAFWMLLRVRVEEKAGEGAGTSVLEELMDGFRFAAGHIPIRLILVFTLINGLLGRTVIELLPAISGKLLDGDATLLAVLTAAAGVGSILGGLLLTRQSDDEAAMARRVLLCLASAGLILLPVNWFTSVWLLAPVVAWLSLATTMAGIGSQALAQLVVRDDFRGRVMSLWTMLSMGAPALGGFVMGALADSIGFVPTLVGFAGLVLVSIAGLWKQLPRIAGTA